MSDEEIVEATARVIGRVGPGRLTLAEVGAEVGLSAATLVQRFGSKRGLLLALSGSGAGSSADFIATVRAAWPSPLDALVEVMACMGEMARTPEEMSNHLAFLQIDLSDADFHRITAAHFAGMRTEIRQLLEESAAAGEITECDPAALARAVQSMANGALLNWAIHREGRAVDAIRDDLGVLLDAYRVRSRA